MAVDQEREKQILRFAQDDGGLARHDSAAARVSGAWWKLGASIWMVLAIVLTFVRVGAAKNFPYPDGARLVILHVPCAWLATLAYVMAAVYAVRFLAIKRGLGSTLVDDYKCAASMELGLLFSILTTISGSIFSRLEWGAFWSWDPRQTSILIIMLIFAAYVVLRGAVSDPERRGRLCSAYALIAAVPGLFLIWVLPRIVQTLHGDANQAVVGGNIGGNYRLVLYGFALPAFLGIFIWLFQLKLRAQTVEERFENRRYASV